MIRENGDLREVDGSPHTSASKSDSRSDATDERGPPPEIEAAGK